jgi:O-antigen/teichoic acid export membrane protein
MLARGSVGYLRAQIDTLLVSQFYSLSLLGKFNIAREFTILPANEVVRPAVEPLLATFSMVKTDRGKLAGQVSLTLLLISCFTAPFVAFLFYFNGPIVFYLLGEQWSDAAPLMQAMTPLLFAFSLGGVLSNLCIALAKVRMVFFYDLISLFFISLVLLLAQGFSLEYFVWLRSFLALITVLLLLYYCNYLAGTSFMRQLLLLATPLLTAFALCSVLHFLFDGEGFIALILDGAIFFIIYFGIILYISHLLNGRSVPWTSLNEYSSMALNRVLFFLKNKS